MLSRLRTVSGWRQYPIRKSRGVNMQPTAQRVLRRLAIELNCGALGLATRGVLLVAAGCGNRGVAIAPVAGTVLYKGVPVEGAWVQFIPEDAPVIAGGFTDEMGHFELTTYSEGDGAPVGEHTVTISMKPRAADDSQEIELKRAEAAKVADPEDRAKKLGEIADSRKQRIIRFEQDAQNAQDKIPKKYASPKTSGLSFTVAVGTENECEFNLTD